MDRTTMAGGNPAFGSNANPLSNPATAAKLDGAAQSAHKTVDTVAGRTTDQVDRLSEKAHRAVDGAAEAVSSAAQWASGIPEQASAIRAKVGDAACASIRARPITSVAGALVVGYLVGRLARW